MQSDPLEVTELDQFETPHGNRAQLERAIMALAALLALAFLLLFFADEQFFRGGGRDRSDTQRLGFIQNQNGDTRIRFSESLAWNPSRAKENLIDGDTLFTGPNSKLKIALNNGEFELSENSLIVIKSSPNGLILNLEFGEIKADIEKADQPIELAVRGKSPVRLNSPKQRLNFQVKTEQSGEVQAQVLQGDDQSKVALSSLTKLPELDLVSVNPSQVDDSLEFNLAGDLTQIDGVTVQFAKEPSFQKPLVVTRAVPSPAISWRIPSSVQTIEGHFRVVSVDKKVKSRPVSFSWRRPQPEPAPKVQPEFAEPIFQNLTVIPADSYPTQAYASVRSAQSTLFPKGLKLGEADLSEAKTAEIKVGQKVYPLWGSFALPKNEVMPGTIRYQFRFDESLPWSDEREHKVLLDAPRDLSYERVSEKRWLSPSLQSIPLKWTPTVFTKGYELEIEDLDKKETIVRRLKKNTAEIKLPAQRSARWRVRSLDQNQRPISDYSRWTALDRGTPPRPVQPEVIAPALVEPPRELASVENPLSNESLYQVPNDDVFTLPYREQGAFVALGSGFNYTNYRQEVPGVGLANDNNVAGPSRYLEAGYFHKIGATGMVTFKETPGQVRLRGTNLRGQTYTWTTVSAEGMYERSFDQKLFGHRLTVGGRAGFQNHIVPYLIQRGQAQLDLVRNQIQTGSVGFLTRMDRGRISYHWTMRYQIPFASQGSPGTDFSITPNLTFDGLVGASYRLTNQWRMGWFWYGQYHDYGFSFSDSTQTGLLGTQQLFYSNMDLTVGYDF